MNKGTAIVGFFMSFLAGMFLMWGIDRSGGMEIAAETASAEGGSVDHTAAVIPVGDDDPTWGNADAPVTIVEISDFECPFCGKVNPTMKELKEKYGKEKLRIVWKHHPLPFHKAARPAHEAAAAVQDLAGSEAFWKFHDLAFANRKGLNDENFKKWAVESGVDGAKFDEAIKTKKYSAKVDKDLAMARSIGANGTPHFRINGLELSGAQPTPKFVELIDAQLAEAQKLVAAGTKPGEVYPILVGKNAKADPNAKKGEDAQQAPPEDTTVWAVPVFNDDPKKGTKEPLVTIVEFSEFQCPFCKRVLETTKQIIDTYGDDVQIVWKDNPLGFHPRAAPASNVARAVYIAKGDKGFWDAHDKIFESQPKLEDADLFAAVKDLGVPQGVLSQAISSNKYSDKFEESADLASDFQARGTPHFFVNGIRVKGAQPFEEFKKVIDEQLKKAKAMVAKGTPRSKIYEEIMKEGTTPPPPPKKDIDAAPADSPVKGNKNAKIVIHEFSDFECPFCSRVNPTMKQVLDEHGDDVKIVWRHMPLPFHKNAPIASEASIEIQKQKGDVAFWQYHDKLFAGQKEPGLDRPALEKYAEEIGGIDMAKFKKALDDHTHQARVEADSEAGKKAGISGTPGFVINGYFISGAQPYGAFKKAIKLAEKEL
jgi:protein-disulfide isomerase